MTDNFAMYKHVQSALLAGFQKHLSLLIYHPVFKPRNWLGGDGTMDTLQSIFSNNTDWGDVAGSE